MADEVKINDSELDAETAAVSAKGSITVSWYAKKQSNDIWRAFDLIRFIAFNAWGISESESKNIAKSRAEEKYDAGKARWYTTKAGSITFNDNGSVV